MALIDIISTLNCSLGSVLGTGSRGCDFNFENVESMALIPSGTRIPSDATYDRDYVLDLQKKGEWIPLNNIYDATWTPEEDQVETSESKGLESVTRKGLYKLEIMFKNGLYNQKVINSLAGFGRWDVILFDEDGNQMHVDLSSGIKGFSTGRFSVSPIEFKNGTNSMKTKIVMQFTKSKEFGADIGFIGEDSIPFNPDEILGVNQIRLSIPSAPIDGATTIAVKTVLDKDGSSFPKGLLQDNYLVRVNGATVVASGISEDSINKINFLTVPALNVGDVVTVGIYDTANSLGVIATGISPDEILYQSTTATTTVVA